jgi:hypothetical protein
LKSGVSVTTSLEQPSTKRKANGQEEMLHNEMLKVIRSGIY